MDPQSLPWLHILTEAGLIVIPLLVSGYFGYRHLMWTLTEYPPHRHQEKYGHLDADGIVYPRHMEGAD